MKTEPGPQFQVALLGDVPPAVHQAVIEQLISAKQAEVKLAGNVAGEIRVIAENYKEQVHHLMGADKYKQLRAYVAEERKAQAERLHPLKEPEISTDKLATLRKQHREASMSFLNKLGVSANDLARLTRDTHKQLEQLIPPPQMYKGKPVELVLLADVPADIRAKKTNPWTQIAPPYHGWASDANGGAGGFGFTSTFFLDQATGFVGSINELTDPNAGDLDVGVAECNVSVGFWYRMPSSGFVEVWIEGESCAANHYLDLYDEFGWSDSLARQINYMTLLTANQYGSDTKKKSQMSRFEKDGYTSGHWNERSLSNHGTYWAHLFSSVVYPSGSWVYIQVGTSTYHLCTANDVSVYSTMNFSWLVRSVFVESTGG